MKSILTQKHFGTVTHHYYISAGSTLFYFGVSQLPINLGQVRGIGLFPFCPPSFGSLGTLELLLGSFFVFKSLNALTLPLQAVCLLPSCPADQLLLELREGAVPFLLWSHYKLGEALQCLLLCLCFCLILIGVAVVNYL